MITLNAHSKHPMKKKNIVISGIWGQQILMIYDERSQTNSILHTMDVFLQYRDLYLLKYRQFYFIIVDLLIFHDDKKSIFLLKMWSYIWCTNLTTICCYAHNEFYTYLLMPIFTCWVLENDEKYFFKFFNNC